MSWLVSPTPETPHAIWHCLNCHQGDGQNDNYEAGWRDTIAQAAREHVMVTGHTVVTQHGQAQILFPMATNPPVPEDEWNEITRRLGE